MKRPVLTIAAALLAGQAFAQNYNPTIVVTNTYEGSASEIRKPDQLMQVPDSVMRFNLDFDYSVFSTPYRGAYEFHPYLVSMKPRPSVSDESTLFVEAGAGYTLRPEAKLVWSPRIGHGVTARIHGGLDSYFGNYRLCRLGVPSEEGIRSLSWDGSTAKGSDLRGGLGAEAEYAARWGEAGIGVSWLNQSNRDPLLGGVDDRSSYNRMDLSAFARSNNLSGSGLYWEGKAAYRLAGDEMPGFSPREHDIRLEGAGGYGLGNGMLVAADAGLELVRVGASALSSGGLFHVKPHFSFSEGPFSLDLGLCLTGHFRNNPAGMRAAFYQARSQVVYPAIHIRYGVLDEWLALYFDVTGGSRLNTYSSLVDAHHFFRWNYLERNELPLDYSIERYRVALGARGQAASRFQYDFHAGVSRWSNDLLDAVPFNDDRAPRMGYADYDLLFAGLNCSWRSGHALVDGHFTYRHFMSDAQGVFCPAPFSGDIRAQYDWKGRIRGGISAEFATSRTAVYDAATVASLPGYLDLGLDGVFQFTPKLAFWLRLGNLLGTTIQRHPLYAEDGLFVTGGIRFNLR